MSYERGIVIGGRDFTEIVNTCDFSWDDKGGRDAVLSIERTPFDRFEDIELDDIVEIRYDLTSATRWFKGIVAELSTSLVGGLRIHAVGVRDKMKEAYPTGRYGSAVGVANPTNTDITFLEEETGGTLPAGTYTYQVSALDDTGETLAVQPSAGTASITGNNGKITLSWVALANAKKYKVYKGSGTPWEYFETTAISWVDDGRTKGTSDAALPASNTTDSPDIVATDVLSVLTDILTSHLPSDLSTGTLSAGGSTTLDDFNIDDGVANLMDVISSLADIVGDVVWGVDQDGAVYFIPRDDSSIQKTYKIGQDNPTSDLVTIATRSRTRDEVSAVRVEGEAKLSEPDQIDALKASTSTVRGRNTIRKYLPGVTTAATANTAIANIQDKYVSNPDRWSITVEEIDTLIKPGLHFIRLETQFGSTYDFQVQSASYSFGDTPSVSLESGDPEFSAEDEAAEASKADKAASLRANISPNAELVDGTNSALGIARDINDTAAALNLVSVWVPYTGS